MESKTAKYTFWGAVIAAFITGSIALYIHLDGKAAQNKEVNVTGKLEGPNDAARLVISNTYVPPVNTSIDSAFFVEVINYSQITAKDVNIKINFGESSVSKCETLPENKFFEEKESKNSIINITVGEILGRDSFYIYCLISHPVFDSILVTGSNLYSNALFDYGQQKPLEIERTSGFVTFFKVIASIVALIFIGYFTILVISILNSKFKKFSWLIEAWKLWLILKYS